MIVQFGNHIKVRNINTSLKFYMLFGMKPSFAYGSKKFTPQFKAIETASEKYNGVVFEINNSLLEIADGHVAVSPHMFKEMIKSLKVSAMLYVQSINKIIKICKENSYPITAKQTTYPWGTKEVVIKDPDGFVLVFIERIK